MRSRVLLLLAPHLWCEDRVTGVRVQIRVGDELDLDVGRQTHGDETSGGSARKKTRQIHGLAAKTGLSEA